MINTPAIATPAVNTTRVSATPYALTSRLSVQQIATYAPSVYGTQHDGHRSDKYQFFSTADIIDKLEEQGFVPTYAAQNGGRNGSNPSARRHLVRFAHTTDIDAGIKHGERPEIVLVNSHNGSSTYELMAGILRLVCSNGMMAVDASTGGIVKIKHIGHTIDEVIAASLNIRDNFAATFEAIKEMKSIHLTDYQAREFAKNAAVVRFGEDAAKRGAIVHPERLLNARRNDDTDMTLWNVFNRVQENVIRGGETVVRRAMRPVNNISANVKFNSELWQLAQGYRENMIAA